MGAEVEVRCTLTDGASATGVRLTAVNRNAWDALVAEWYGTTGDDGSWTWPNIDTGAAGDFYDIYAKKVDDVGVKWSASASDRINGDRVIRMRLTPTYVGALDVPEAAVKYLEASPDGKAILSSLDELKRAVGSGLIQGTITLSTYVLEGLNRVTAKASSVWKDAWETKTYSQLMEVPEVLALFPSNLKDRARALADLRRPGAHFKQTTSLAAEAQIAAKTVEDTVTAWCRPS